MRAAREGSRGRKRAREPEEDVQHALSDESDDDDDSMGSLREFIVNDSDECSDVACVSGEEDDDSNSGDSGEEAEEEEEEEDEDESVRPSWIDEKNIISGKRRRVATTRYVDDDYARLMLEDASDYSSSDSESECSYADEEETDEDFEAPGTSDSSDENVAE